MPLRKNKCVTTILQVSGKIENDVTLTTDEVFNFDAFVYPLHDIKMTDSGSLVACLPVKSNIHLMDGLLDTEHRGIPFSDAHIASDGHDHAKIWVDGINRVTASKVERDRGMTYVTRGDIVMDLINKGHGLIQCDHSVCTVHIPNEISVDMTRYMVKKPTIRPKKDGS